VCVCVCVRERERERERERTEKMLIIGVLKRSDHDLCSVDKGVKLYVLKHHHSTKTCGGC